MIRTLKFTLCHDPTKSYHANQQNAAFNHAVDILNRQSDLPKRSTRITPTL